MRFPFEVEGRLSPVFSDDGMAEEVEKGFASLRGMSRCQCVQTVDKEIASTITAARRTCRKGVLGRRWIESPGIRFVLRKEMVSGQLRAGGSAGESR